MSEKLFLENMIADAKDLIYRATGKSYQLKNREDFLNLAKIMAELSIPMRNDIKTKEADDYSIRFLFIGIILAEYGGGNNPIYKVADEFGKHLYQTKLKLPPQYFPRTNKHLYIEISPKLSYELSACISKFRSAFVSLAAAGVSIYLFGDDVDTQTSFKAHFKYNENYTDLQDLIDHTLIDAKYIITDDVLAGSSLTEDKKAFDKQITHNFVKFIFKCLMYILSGNPDLQREAAPVITTKKPKKLRRLLENNNLFDVIRVGYSFQGKRTYHVDGTIVQTHLRWQPYGPGRSQYRLITIDEHERHYKTTFNHSPELQPI